MTDGKRAAHSYTARYADEVFSGIRRPTLTQSQLAQVKPVVHPVVRTHPKTGRKGLFVNENFTTHILDLHLATGCPSHLRRRMHRTTIQGEVPF